MDIKTEILEPEDEKEDIPEYVEPAAIEKLNKNIQIKNELVDIDCNTCSEKFTNEVAFKIHEMLHRNDSYCFVCKRTISNDFHKHVKSRHMDHVCEICNRVYTLKKILDNHIRSHKKERMFKCDKCEKSFMQNGALSTHINSTHKGFKPFVCEKCGGTFTTSSSLKKHLRRMHSEEKIYECNICCQKFSEKKGRNDHEKNHIKLRVCEICNQKFARRESLLRHLLGHFKTVTCIHCKRMFHKSQIDSHITDKHQPRECSVCQLIFYDGSTLSKHQVCHQSRITCKLCNRRYAESNMKRHMKLHAANKVQICGICNYIFLDIDKHNARMHKNTKFCFCSLCPKKFHTRSEKTRHVAEVHYTTGGKHICNICGKAFVVSSALTQHLNTHHHVQPYKCLMCRRVFNNLYRLEKHTEMHHNKHYKFKCTSCGRAFKIEQSLNSHKCGGTFTCHLCDIKYKDKHYLKRHMITYHSPTIFTDVDDIGKTGIARINFLKDGSKKFQCKKCQAVFKHLNSFKRHFCNIQNRIGYNCPVCRKKYKMKKDLVQHINEKHPSKRLKCDVCGLLFINKRCMRIHYIKMHVLYKDSNVEYAIKKEEEMEIVNEEIKMEDDDSSISIKQESIIKSIYIKEEPIIKTEILYNDPSELELL